jgi:toxin ParE1/3/4
MGFKIVFTKPAVEDLNNLVAFISRDNPRAGEQFGYELVDKAQSVAEHPFIGRVVPEFKLENLREIIHRPYRILYRVREEQKVIEILRVWHAARGIPKV